MIVLTKMFHLKHNLCALNFHQQTILYKKIHEYLFCDRSDGITTKSWKSTAHHHTHTRWRHQIETFSALLALCAGIHRSPVNSPHKGQWRGALMFSLMCTWMNGWVNNREAGDLRRHRAHYDVIVMIQKYHTGSTDRKDRRINDRLRIDHTRFTHSKFCWKWFGTNQQHVLWPHSALTCIVV